MKTNFESEEDRYWLDRIIWRAIMQGESILFADPLLNEIKEYRVHLFELRRKCFEYLEEEDPNEEYLNELIK